jgi:hypothetical protein
MPENEPNDPGNEPANDATPEAEPTPEPAQEPDWKAEARKWEKRAKDNSDAAARLKEVEDAQKTDADRQAERVAELESTAKTSTLEAARLRVALRKGLTETQAKRLVGDTEEDLETDADELLATFASPEDDGQQPGRRPQERLRPGATPSGEPEKSPEELAEAVIQRRGY